MSEVLMEVPARREPRLVLLAEALSVGGFAAWATVIVPHAKQEVGLDASVIALALLFAGVLAAGEHPEEAQQFVEYLTREEGQQALADSYALEYPLNPAVSFQRAELPVDLLQLGRGGRRLGQVADVRPGQDLLRLHTDAAEARAAASRPVGVDA